MGNFRKKMKLYQSLNIIPNPNYIHRCEVYDMNPHIGFKVENICFILYQTTSYRIISQNELKKKSGTVYSTIPVLFENALKCLVNDTISPSDTLVSIMPNSMSIWKRLLLYCIYFNTLLEFTPRESSSSSPSEMLRSKRMPQDEKFLRTFKRKYATLRRTRVIVHHDRQMKYKIADYTIEERRHAIIIIQGPKHAFVLELYYQRFNNRIYNCPNIRYISDDEVKKMGLSFTTNMISADELVQRAITTVSNMGDYNILENNCQNFVQNYLSGLRGNVQPGILEGEVVVYIMDILSSSYFRITGPLLLCIVYLIYDRIPIEFGPVINNFVAFISLFLVLSFVHMLSKTHGQLLFRLVIQVNIILIVISIFGFSNKNVAIFHIFFLSLFVFTFRVMRLQPLNLFSSFLVLALLVYFIAYNYISLPMLPSIAMALYTATFGSWMAVGNSWNREYTVILPSIVAMIMFCFGDFLIYCEYILIFFLFVLFCLNIRKLEGKYFVIGLLSLVTVEVSKFCIHYSGKETPFTYFVFNCLLLSFSFLKIILKYYIITSWPVYRN